MCINNWGPGPYNSLRDDDNRKYFSGHYLTQNRREANMIYMARNVGKVWRYSSWEKGNFVMINEFKYGHIWKIWPSSLCSIYLISLERHETLDIYDLSWEHFRNARFASDLAAFLTLSWEWSLLYRNQSTALQSKWMDRFLYDRNLRRERVKSSPLEVYTNKLDPRK